jgi:hypothetical protein
VRSTPPSAGAPAPQGPGRRLVSLREDVDVEYVDPYRAGRPLRAHTPWGTVELGPQDRPGRTALWRMTLGPVDASNMSGDDRPPGPDLEALFERLADVIVHSLAPADGTAPVLSVVPLVPGARFRPVGPGARAAVRLVPGVVTTRREDGLAIVAADGRHRVDLHRPPAVLLPAALREPRGIPDLIRSLDGQDPDLTREAVEHLLGAGVASCDGGTIALPPRRFSAQPQDAAGH